MMLHVLTDKEILAKILDQGADPRRIDTEYYDMTKNL